MARQRERLIKAIAEQRKWIEDCEANGISYADGQRGCNIRNADENELRRLTSTLALIPPYHGKEIFDHIDKS